MQALAVGLQQQDTPVSELFNLQGDVRPISRG